MKILVTGASGMLGSDLVRVLSENHEIYGMVRKRDERPSFFVGDVTNRAQTINDIERIKPRVVIHCAAMTDVDGCENNRLMARQVNFEGTKNVVDGCRHIKGFMIYISTDFVFSGSQEEAYKESNLPNPISVYGETKLLGEFYVRSQSTDYLILRTSWTFGSHGRNFVSKILERAGRDREFEVVNDQFGTPTYTLDAARAIDSLIDAIGKQRNKETPNAVYHLANAGSVSRYDFAIEILKQRGIKDVVIHPVGSEVVAAIAKRPRNSALDCSRIEKKFGIRMRSWTEALADYLKEWNDGKKSTD